MRLINITKEQLAPVFQLWYQLGHTVEVIEDFRKRMAEDAYHNTRTTVDLVEGYRAQYPEKLVVLLVD